MRPEVLKYLPDGYGRGGEALREEESHETAKRHAARADENFRELSALINRHLAGLLGSWVHGTFGRLLEDVGEHQGEAFYCYAEALAVKDDRHANEMAFALSETLQLKNVLRDAVRETMARGERPTWVADASRLAGFTELEPF